jgi:predicted branched-subunit amino acid permease
VLGRLVKLGTSGPAVRVRAQRDYWLFVMTRLWPLWIGTAGVLAGVVTVAPSAWGLGLSVAAVIVSLRLGVPQYPESGHNARPLGR